MATLTLTLLVVALLMLVSQSSPFFHGAATERVVGLAAARGTRGGGGGGAVPEEVYEDSSGGLYREAPYGGGGDSSDSHSDSESTPPPRSASLAVFTEDEGPAAWNLEGSSEKISISGVSGSAAFQTMVSSVEHTLSSVLGSGKGEDEGARSDQKSSSIDVASSAKETQDGPCNSSDFQLWDDISSDTFHEKMNNCGRSCLGNEGCVAACVSDSMGYSESCSSCFSILSKCAMAHCMWQCIGGEGASCRECGRENCRAPFALCTGFPGRPGH